MDTNSNVRAAAGAVIGARHQHAGRNGQDAAATFITAGVAVAVVCDGCSSGASSEVGARLGARWFAERLGHAVVAGEDISDRATWEAARRDVTSRLRAIAELGELAEDAGGTDGAIAGVDADAVHALLLFTIVAVAVTPACAAVWALGDGAYGCDGRVRVLGPFEDNAPPYLAYDLLGAPAEAHFEVLPTGARRIIIATDGAADLDYDLAAFGAVSTANPDALRRRLAVLARGDDRIAWSEGRVIRTPAVLQDDCAIAIVERLA